MGTTKKAKGMTRKSQTAQRKAREMAARVRVLEELVDLLLDFALRGYVLPSERRVIKRYRGERKEEQRVRIEKDAALRCPACRSPLSDPLAERCPYCSLLLAEARWGEKSLGIRKRPKSA